MSLISGRQYLKRLLKSYIIDTYQNITSDGSRQNPTEPAFALKSISNRQWKVAYYQAQTVISHHHIQFQHSLQIHYRVSNAQHKPWNVHHLLAGNNNPLHWPIFCLHPGCQSTKENITIQLPWKSLKLFSANQFSWHCQVRSLTRYFPTKIKQQTIWFHHYGCCQ